MKKEIQNILKYYLEYEISNILNSSELKISKNSIILSKERLQNIRNIKQELRNIKEKTLENFIYKLCDIIQSQEFYLYSHYITYINNQNQNYQEVKNLPIFIFNCEIDEENIKILEVNVNPETLNIILSVILKKDITEVVLDYGDEIENYRKEIINTIDGGDIFHLIDLYYSKLEEYTTISKEQIKNIYKKNRNYRMNEEYIITLDELASQSIKNIKEDIEALIEIIKNDNYVPKILDKYLENQEVNKKDIDDTKYQKPYLGNYKNEYGVSQIQYEIVNAIKDNDITAIEGPPGTGKTSLLKEIIANNIVERANLILKNWDEGLEYKKSKIEYYNINWFKENQNVIKSIVVSSKNGEAIENVGKEINKEIKYLFPIARKYERIEKKGKKKDKVPQQYKGMVCLPLGKQDNIICFKDFLYGLFIPMLEKIEDNSQVENIAEKVKNKYERKLKETKEFEKIIEMQKIINDREKYFYGIEISKEDEKQERETKIQNIEKIFLKNAIDKEKEYEKIKNEKEEEKEHVNTLEIDACIETIKYILQENEGENPTIAVITPFKKQTLRIEDRLKNEGLKDIKVGTVHAFQGQEKEYIIFSQVIDSPIKRRITDFIGGKGNMLNVAVTRAKKQFIFIGNVDVALRTRNYLTKLIEYIRKNGELYSLYYKEDEVSEHVFDEEILKILQPEIKLEDDKIGHYIQSNFIEGILHDAKKHYEFLKYAIENAQKEIYIMSPWYRENVIDDQFIETIKKLKTNGGSIKINFGYNKGNRNITNAKELAEELSKTKSLGFISKEMAEEIANKMYENIGKESFIYAPPTHAKILIIDNKYMCIGSHNWLSNAGKTNETERKKEVSRLTTSPKAIEYVKEKIFE